MPIACSKRRIAIKLLQPSGLDWPCVDVEVLWGKIDESTHYKHRGTQHHRNKRPRNAVLRKVNFGWQRTVKLFSKALNIMY